MYLDKTKKEEIFTQYGKSVKDTGSAESQIALFTYRIAHLTEHVKQNHKDFVTTRSLTQLVGMRRGGASCASTFSVWTLTVTARSSWLLACVSNSSAAVNQTHIRMLTH